MPILLAILAPFAIIAGCLLGLVLFILGNAELDIQAKDIIIHKKNVELGEVAEVIRDKGTLSVPVKLNLGGRND